MPDAMVRWGEGWKALHPDWDAVLWTPMELSGIAPHLAKMAGCLTQLSDLYRYYILRECGGVYVDTDLECRRNLEPLLAGWDLVVPRKRDSWICNCFIAAVPHHAVLDALVLGIEGRLREGRGVSALGSGYLTEAVETRMSGVRILPPELMLPYSPEQMVDRVPLDAEFFPDAYAVHHWASVWNPGSLARFGRHGRKAVRS